VLQAADILLYKATHVPVGEDQAQHLELARDIAQAFHSTHLHGQPPLFPLPATVLLPTGARLQSLRDGTKKMSKSDSLDESRINLTDSADVIANKVKGARTDSAHGWSHDPATRPDKSNLLAIYAAVSGREVVHVAAEYADASAVHFKGALTDLLVSHLCPIGKDIGRRLADKGHLVQVLRQGGDRARGIAQATMKEVREVAGYAQLR
jgi:tryptophanyl-tRNA synthetase